MEGVRNTPDADDSDGAFGCPLSASETGVREVSRDKHECGALEEAGDVDGGGIAADVERPGAPKDSSCSRCWC